jgi:hypothetical protein
MTTIPTIGDRVERRVAGISQYGTVHYADQLQVLVKWDNGSSSSLRIGIHMFRVLGHAPAKVIGHREGATLRMEVPAR